MTFPTTPIPTENLDSSADNPSLARVDLLQAVTSLNTIMAEANGPFGVMTLQNDGSIPPDRLPAIFNPTGTLYLDPTEKVVKIQNVLRLQLIPASVLVTLTTGFAGDVALCSDADSGNPALCIYNGTDWKYLPLASFTTLTV